MEGVVGSSPSWSTMKSPDYAGGFLLVGYTLIMNEDGLLERQNNTPLTDDEWRKLFKRSTPEDVDEVTVLVNRGRVQPISKERVKLWLEYDQIRDQVIQDTRQALRARMEQQPEADEEEMGLGIFREGLEPQVVDAVLTLRRKGYSTHFSGFDRQTDGQFIDFEEDYFTDDWEPPEELIDLATEYQEQGITLYTEPNKIGFQVTRLISLDEIKIIWDKIAALLPPLGKEPLPAEYPAAVKFREVQQAWMDEKRQGDDQKA